jgi:hypothetical protein
VRLRVDPVVVARLRSVYAPVVTQLHFECSISVAAPIVVHLHLVMPAAAATVAGLRLACVRQRAAVSTAIERPVTATRMRFSWCSLRAPEWCVPHSIAPDTALKLPSAVGQLWDLGRSVDTSRGKR